MLYVSRNKIAPRQHLTKELNTCGIRHYRREATLSKGPRIPAFNWIPSSALLDCPPFYIELSVNQRPGDEARCLSRMVSEETAAPSLNDSHQELRDLPTHMAQSIDRDDPKQGWSDRMWSLNCAFWISDCKHPGDDWHSMLWKRQCSRGTGM